MKKVALFTVCLLALIFVPVLANKTSVSIKAPTEAEKGKEIKVVISVTHSGNTRLHHTDWVVLSVNGKEVKKWEYDRSNRPDSENFTLEYTLVIEEESVIEAQGNCNLHGSTGKDQVIVKLIEE